MDDLKKGAREGEVNAKEAWRNSDGEDLSDKVGNAGDEIRKDLGNAGDDVSNAGYDSADTSKEAWRKADGDESLADKIGNAGDDMRNTVDDR